MASEKVRRFCPKMASENFSQPSIFSCYFAIFTSFHGVSYDMIIFVNCGLLCCPVFLTCLIIQSHAFRWALIAFYFILSSEINVYQKWIKVIFSLQK